MGLNSLYYFAKYIVGLKDMAIQPHWELCSFIQRWLGHDVLILLPRGTFKSSIISIALPIWLLIHNRDLRILITSSKLGHSKNWLGVIQQHIETNEQFRMLYGNLRGEGVWHSTAMSVSGRTKFTAEQSIVASSCGTSQVSQHHDVAIGDDLHDDENITSKEMIDSVMEYLGGLLPILDPQPGGLFKTKMRRGGGSKGKRGPRILVGTNWHFDDCYSRILANERRRRRDGKNPVFRTLVRRAENRARTVFYFPSRFNKEYLDEIKEQPGMTRYFYSCQYLNDPLPEEDQIFKLSDIGFFHSTHRVCQGEVLPMPDLLNKVVVCDPSMGETDESDYASIVTDAFDLDRNFYCWEVIRDRFIGPSKLLNRLYEAYQDHLPIKVGIEEVSFQKSLRYGFQKLIRDKGVYFHITKLKTSTRVSKPMRIEGFEPFVSGHKFFLRVQEGTDLTLPSKDLYYCLVDGQDVLADEMLRFPLAPTDDCIDAQAYMPQLIVPGGRAKKPLPGRGTFGELKRRLKRTQEQRRRLAHALR